MNMKHNVSERASLNDMRMQYICALNEAENKTEFAIKNAESLFNLGLTMYSQTFSFESAIYNGLTRSRLAGDRSLHPQQVEIIKQIDEHKGLILSAPTSFGKTFAVFEYIARKRPKNVVMIVPTLALIDEYKRKIINEYKSAFEGYKVYLTINRDLDYNFDNENIFLVTHDRVISQDVHEIIPEIDFLVIDEVYKLQKDDNNERVLILNLAYYNMVALSKKYVLLAPFISGVRNLEKLNDKPYFFSTDYSPVVNDVVSIPIIDEKDRLLETQKILDKISGKTLVYFPTVIELNKYILNNSNDKTELENGILNDFVRWAKAEIHEEWTVVKALERGMLVHHGQLPMGIRMLELDLFDKKDNYNVMLCTSTLLEGVNTTAENIIITKPARNETPFDAFDFYNLVGRTGRLFKHCLGKAYYIKAVDDREYEKGEALKSIEFELTSDSIDIDINKGTYAERKEFIEFLEKLSTDYAAYKENVASKMRFNSVQELYTRYAEGKNKLLSEIEQQRKDSKRSRLYLIRELYSIAEGKTYLDKMNTFIINKLLYKTRPSVKKVIEDTRACYTNTNLQYIIKTVLDKKNSYIEYTFYKKIQIIVFFMKAQHVDQNIIQVINDKLISLIENIYFVNMPAQRMLKDLGIYEKDISKIVDFIGTDFQTVDGLQQRLLQKDVIEGISVVSRYVINRLIGR